MVVGSRRHVRTQLLRGGVCRLVAPLAEHHPDQPRLSNQRRGQARQNLRRDLLMTRERKH